ncbi:MAG: sacsin N-terminal ATP-binding-like domain-containing protein [Verrucomicrobiia bacterium]
MATPKEIIEDIRRNKYAIGLETSPESEKVIEELKKSLNNALEQLAQDIYSKETHFILELIQNADDNAYESTVIPELKIAIDDEKILFQNNEKGFTEDNVKALCDVGYSTKSKACGYIGEKGIGFKSVFRISNEPHIFSNGFQFKFKLKDEKDKLGYVVPQWVDDVPDYIDKKSTNILLPIIEKAKSNFTKFSIIEPTLILFLRKLKIIQIHCNGSTNNIVRIDNEDGKVEIEHPKGKEYWKLVKQNLNVPTNIQEEKRKGVEETELILAFPLKQDGSADTISIQNVFAYLPIRTYGFKFVIQADFLVPANREDIHKDKQWNEWLRDNIASVFLMAVEEFKQDENLKSTYYNYIPLTNEVTDEFFSPVVNHIYSNLRESECILTESGNWRKPQEVIRADKDIRNLIQNDDLKKFFNMEYISSNIKFTKPILDALRVPEFKFYHLVQCLQKVEWLDQQSDEWFNNLYNYLNIHISEEKQIEELKSLKVIRLENNELVSISEGNIFFPLDKNSDYGFEKELRVVKKALLESKEKETRDSVIEFLKKIGVRNAQPYNIIENHILPIYESNDTNTNWQSKDSKTLLGYIRYIKENLKDYEKESDKRLNSSKSSWQTKEDPLGRLKNSLYIRVYNCVKCNNYEHPQNIYLPNIYGNRNELEHLFEGIEDIYFVHREYINDIIDKYRRIKRKNKILIKESKQKRDREILEWRDFFLKIGVDDKPRVILDPMTCRETQYYLDGLKHVYNKQKPNWCDSYYGYYIENDYVCPDIEKIFRHLQTDKVKILIRIFDTYWDNYKQMLKCKYWYRKPRAKYWAFDYSESSFMNLLINTNWLPTSKGTFAKPSEVFLNKPEIRDIFGDSVRYLAIEIKNEDLISDLGIHKEVNVKLTIDFLIQFCRSKCQDIDLFKKLYNFLNNKYENNEFKIRNAFSEEQIIYLPNENNSYFTSKEVLWKDVSDIFGENRGYLEKHYPELKQFFLCKLGINEKPKSSDYANLLINISKKNKIDEKDEKIIRIIYKELNNHLDPENDNYSISEEQWWKDFISEHIFLTDKNTFCKNDNNIFVNDDPELYDLFKDKANIYFLKLPNNFYPQIQYFIRTANIKYLTKAVSIELVNNINKTNEDCLTKKIQTFAIYILQYLYTLDNNMYNKLKNDGILDKIKNVTCYSVDKLEVKYTLNGQTAQAPRKAIFYDGNLYIQKDNVNDTDHLAIELSKLFGEIRGLDDFLILLFDKSDNSKIENYLKAKGIQELPEEEINWFQKIKSEKTPTVQEKDKKWQPECQPEEANITIGEFSGSKTPINSQLGVNITNPTLNQSENTHCDTLSQEDNINIGKWGEEYAFKCIIKEMSDKYHYDKPVDNDQVFEIKKDNKVIVEVKWLNKYKESKEPYDIEFNEDGKKYLIEVKSTIDTNKKWFEVSKKQWDLMREKMDEFYIYRVYCAGTKNAKTQKIQDPVKLWLDGVIDAYPIRIEL